MIVPCVAVPTTPNKLEPLITEPVISFPTNILFVVVMSVGALPVISNEPVNICVSSVSSPNIVEPLKND